jgi:hypothetical protein
VSVDLVSALLGGTFTLVGTTIGTLLTYGLNARTERRQQAYELNRENQAAAREDYRVLSSQETNEHAAAAARLIRDGGVMIPPRIRSTRTVEIGPEDMQFACVPHGTLIAMADGSFKSIEYVTKGDIIATYDAGKQVRSSESVADLVTGENSALVRINHTYQVTPGQKVLADGVYRGAEELNLAQGLVDQQSRQILVTSLEIVAGGMPCSTVLLESGHGFFTTPDADTPPIIIREGETGKVGTRRMVFHDGRLVVE